MTKRNVTEGRVTMESFSEEVTVEQNEQALISGEAHSGFRVQPMQRP